MSFDCGIMISASHNPYYDNGIKLLINGNGEKMDEGTISLIEAYLDGEVELFGEKYSEVPYAHEKEKIGRTVRLCIRKEPLCRISDFLLGMYSFKGVKVCIRLCEWKFMEYCQIWIRRTGSKDLRDQCGSEWNKYQ